MKKERINGVFLCGFSTRKLNSDLFFQMSIDIFTGVKQRMMEGKKKSARKAVAKS